MVKFTTEKIQIQADALPPPSALYVTLLPTDCSKIQKQSSNLIVLKLRTTTDSQISSFERILKMNRRLVTTIALVTLMITCARAGMNNPVVGGKEMYPTKNIIENAVNSADHTTLVAAVKAAGLVETLDTLLKPENKSTLTKVLTYHVVAGRWSKSDLMKKIREGNGSAELTTVE